MGLISREAAIEALEFERDCLETPERINGVEDAIEVIQQLPSVPAVPLDKLCEWLADNYEPPANVSDGKALDDHEFCVTLWRYVLEKMMEEQDATD